MPTAAARGKTGFAAWAFLALGCLVFLGLRFQRLERGGDPQGDEGVYLHVASYLHDSGESLSGWYFIPRGGLFPPHGPPYRQSIVQPGLPALLSPWMAGDPLRAGRIGIFLIGGVGLACSAFVLWRIGGPWAAAACALFTGLSFSQLEYGTLIHTETPMTAVAYVSLALLLWLLPKHPRAAAFLAAAAAGTGLYFRTNGVFFPLAMAFCLFLRRKEFSAAWIWALAGCLLVMAPLLVYSAIFLGSPLASDSGDILWAASLQDFRAAHAAPLGIDHFLAAQGWTGLLLRPWIGAGALAARLVAADYGRSAPLLALGLIGFWLRRKELAVQILAAGILPTVAVAIWVSPVSWCERYLAFFMPAWFGMAGAALAWLQRKIPATPRFARLARLALPLFFTALILPFVPPHRYLQRAFDAPAPIAFAKTGLAELERRLQAEGNPFLVGNEFSRFNWGKPSHGANLPSGVPVDSVAGILKAILPEPPTGLILSDAEARALSPRESGWLSSRLLFRAGPFSVFTLGDRGNSIQTSQKTALTESGVRP